MIGRNIGSATDLQWHYHPIGDNATNSLWHVRSRWRRRMKIWWVMSEWFLRHSFFGRFVDPYRCWFALDTIDIFMKTLQKVSKEFLRVLLTRKDETPGVHSPTTRTNSRGSEERIVQWYSWKPRDWPPIARRRNSTCFGSSWRILESLHCPLESESFPSYLAWEHLSSHWCSMYSNAEQDCRRNKIIKAVWCSINTAGLSSWNTKQTVRCVYRRKCRSYCIAQILQTGQTSTD